MSARHVDPFADPARIAMLSRYVHELAVRLDRSVTLMEVCGRHTHAIAEAGLRRLLPESVRLISGPGCPVCVTPVDYFDHAIALARRPDVVVCTSEDLLRVPASHRDSLDRARAAGADVRVVLSPRDALDVARRDPGREVVFLAVGFETTTPRIAVSLAEAEEQGTANFSLLVGSKRIEPSLRALVTDPEIGVDGFLLPADVPAILGADAYRFLVEEYRIPAAVAGFAPVDVQAGIVSLLAQMLDGAPVVDDRYTRAASTAGDPEAKWLLDRFFEPVAARWRGLGEIPASGLALRPEWRGRDASRFEVVLPEPNEPPGCLCGEVIKGMIEPPECPRFARECVPEHPIGACMVSSHCTCAAWYRHELHPLEGTAT